MIGILIFFACVFLPVSIASVSSIPTGQEEEMMASTMNPEGELSYPKPPASLATPSERADFMLLHFWDPADFKNPEFCQNETMLEQNFVNFFGLFPYASEKGRKEGVFALLEKAREDASAFRNIQELAEKYAYEPESPMKNEDYYVPFLEYILVSPGLEDYEIDRAGFILGNIRKNHPGSRAADFSFTDRNGFERSFIDMCSGSDNLLIFYDPDCHTCSETMKALATSSTLQNLIVSGELRVIAVYSGDNRILWKMKASQLPGSWTVGYEPGEIDEAELYDIRTLPSLYLIDAQGVVAEKELNPEKYY